MNRTKLNYLAIFVATLIMYVLGALWYSPVMFGKAWMELNGITDAVMTEASPLKMYLTPLVAYLIACYVLAHAVAYAGAKTAATGALVGFWNWLGFVAAVTFVADSLSNKPLSLWLINAGYNLVGFLIAGVLLALWQPKPAASPQA